MEIFKLKNKKHKFYSSNGFYKIYILGGFSIQNLNLISVKLSEVNSQKQIQLKEINFKTRDYINGRKAIACYEFQINNYEEYQIEFNGIENLVVKESMLFFKSLFSSSKASISDLEIVIK